jgi:hypothetical protein
VDDPLLTLRAYRELAPWSLRDLVALANGILDATQVRPINAAANARPNERTVRFYVARDLVTAPDGRGTAATYGYRHLLEVLAVKLRQMEGSTLSAIAGELRTTTGDVLERRVAAALGSRLPAPTDLRLGTIPAGSTGRTGKALGSTHTPIGPAPATAAVTWHRIPVADGVELHVRNDHPVVAHDDRRKDLASAVRLAVQRAAAAASQPTRTPISFSEHPPTAPPAEEAGSS